jgi:hypothetical protein
MITEIFRFGEEFCPGEGRDVARDSAEEVGCMVGGLVGEQAQPQRIAGISSRSSV